MAFEVIEKDGHEYLILPDKEALWDENFEEVEETREPWKHDVSQVSAIFKTKCQPGKFWEVYYMTSYNNGIEDYDFPYESSRVWPHQVTTTEWRNEPPKEDNNSEG